MLLAYVDESFTDEWFCMAALLVDGPAAVTLTTTLDQLALDVAKRYGFDGHLELHGFEIFQGRGGWRQVPPRARVGVFDDVIDAIAQQDVHVIARAMDLTGQRARYPTPEPAHSVVLQHLLERIDDFMTVHQEHALVIADEVAGQAKHRTDLSTYRTIGTTGYRQRKITRIVDTLHFAPSHASRLVQATDIIAFLYRRVHGHVEKDDRARKAKLAMWRRLVPRVHHQLCWFPAKTPRGEWGLDSPMDAQRARDSGP